MALALAKLLSTEDVAEMLGVSPRKVRDLPIPFVRVGKNRKYHPRHIQNYMQEFLECQSANAKTPRTTITTSSSGVVGLREALRQNPSAKQSA